jgi:hypothetical protein
LVALADFAARPDRLHYRPVLDASNGFVIDVHMHPLHNVELVVYFYIVAGLLS